MKPVVNSYFFSGISCHPPHNDRHGTLGQLFALVNRLSLTDASDKIGMLFQQAAGYLTFILVIDLPFDVGFTSIGKCSAFNTHHSLADMTDSIIRLTTQARNAYAVRI